jgi:hypothetical protein
MTEKEMNRYYWRTGQRWCGDLRRETEMRGPDVNLPGWFVALVLVASIATTAALLVLR